MHGSSHYSKRPVPILLTPNLEELELVPGKAVHYGERLMQVGSKELSKSFASPTVQKHGRWDHWVNALLAAILLLGASLKAYQLVADPTSLAFGVIHSQYLMIALIQAEVLLASWLLLNNSSRVRLILAMLCFVVFAAAAADETYRSLASCGCFGLWRISPKITAGFDVVAVALLWLTRPRHQRLALFRTQQIRQFAALMVAVLASGGLWTAFLLKIQPRIAQNIASSADDLVVLEPETWANKRFNLIDEIDGGSSLRSGRWLVVFYHYDCGDCRAAIPNYELLASATRAGSPRIAFVAMNSIAPSKDDPVLTSANCLRLNLRADHDWFATTPIVAAIEDGTVLWADEGEKAIRPPIIPQWK
jgi:hypothetical protein